MLTKTFWLGENGVLVRAVRTWCQTAVAAIGVGQTNLFTADIKNTLALATSAAVVSILMAPFSSRAHVAAAPHKRAHTRAEC